MKTFRTTVTFDFLVDDSVDEDEFHDELYVSLESADLQTVLDANLPTLEAEIETVRDIDVKVLDD